MVANIRACRDQELLLWSTNLTAIANERGSVKVGIGLEFNVVSAVNLLHSLPKTSLVGRQDIAQDESSVHTSATRSDVMSPFR
jgi:hypothetical protein